MKPLRTASVAAVAALATGLALASAGALALQREHVTTATPAWHTRIAAAEMVAAPAERAESLWREFRRWVLESYERAPALVLGLAALLALPPLALLGVLLRSSGRRSEGSIVHSQSLERAQKGDSITEAVFQRPAAEAWIEVDGSSERRQLGRGMLRIGREEDNDLQLLFKTVHRYHAVIHRTPDAYYVVTDLSSAEGNGVLLNGTRVTEARLKDGDTLQLGDAVLRFSVKTA